MSGDAALVDYNRYLVASLEACDGEKQFIINKLDDVATAQSKLGDLRDELRLKERTIFQLQHDLSEHRLMLQEEREKVARLINENAVLQAQAEDDRSKISSLVRMRKAEAIQASQEDPYPVRVSVMRSAPGTAAVGKSKQGQRGEPMSMSLRSVVTEYAAPQVHIDVKASTAAVDALVQPPPSSGLVTALSAEVEGLKQQLDAQRRAYEHERALRVCEERDRQQTQEDVLARYSSTMEHLQQLNNETTKELVTSRHQWIMTERNLHGELEIVRHDLEETKRLLVQQRSRQTADFQRVLKASDTQHHDVVVKLRREILDRTETHTQEQKQLQEQLAALQEQLETAKSLVAKEKKSKKRLAEQHRFENEGLQTEINLMKHHLRSVEKKLYFAHVRADPSSAAPEHA